jgi:hypothetical protein
VSALIPDETGSEKRFDICSGFFLRENGVPSVITNIHCVFAMGEVQIIDARGKIHNVTGVLADGGRVDLIKLRVSDVAPDQPALQKSKDPNDSLEGMKIRKPRLTVLASPRMFELSVTGGTYIGEGTPFFSGDVIKTLNNDVKPGMSGSPVINSAGDVIGITAGLMRYVLLRNRQRALHIHASELNHLRPVAGMASLKSWINQQFGAVGLYYSGMRSEKYMELFPETASKFAEQAVTFYADAAKLDPKYLDPIGRLAYLHFSLGMNEDASAIFALLGIRAARNSLGEADDASSTARQYKKAIPDISFYHALASIRTGEFTVAESTARALLASDPLFSEAHVLLIAALAAEGKSTEIEAQEANFKKLDPSGYAAYCAQSETK